MKEEIEIDRGEVTCVRSNNCKVQNSVRSNNCKVQNSVLKPRFVQLLGSTF